MSDIHIGIPKVSGQDGIPEPFNLNDVLIFKGKFCKYICNQEWDNFNEEEMLLNPEIKQSILASAYNEEFIHKAVYDNNELFAKLAKHVFKSLIEQGLLEEQKDEDQITVYWKTNKLKALCPEIVRHADVVIDKMVSG
jgi:hypothetical protein